MGDSSRQPIARARITLVDRADPTSIVAKAVASAPDFVFDVQRVPPGSYLAFGEWLGFTGLMYIDTQTVEVTGHDFGSLALAPVRADELTGALKLKSNDPPVDLRKINIDIAPLKLGMVPIAVSYPIQAGTDRTFRRRLNFDSDFAGFAIAFSQLPDGCYVDSVRYGDRDVPESGTEFIPDATLEITIGADGRRIDGTIIGDHDHPIGGAVVALVRENGKSSPKSVQADAQGVFHFPAVPPGDYKLLAWDDVSRDDLENPEFVKQFDGQAAAVTLGGFS